jgi:hypothetical protein
MVSQKIQKMQQKQRDAMVQLGRDIKQRKEHLFQFFESEILQAEMELNENSKVSDCGAHGCSQQHLYSKSSSFIYEPTYSCFRRIISTVGMQETY